LNCPFLRNKTASSLKTGGWITSSTKPHKTDGGNKEKKDKEKSTHVNEVELFGNQNSIARLRIPKWGHTVSTAMTTSTALNRFILLYELL
jgi:hypothetical protein